MWKSIPKWKKYYEVNEYGDVRNKKTKNLITGDINNAGYHRVCLYNKPKKKRFFRHRLVALLFLENPNNYTEVNHIDGDKNNNHVSNLEWVDRQKNEREAHRTGLKLYHPFKVIFTNGDEKTYEFVIDLANEINVTRRSVLNYLQGKSKGYIKHNIILIEYL